MKYHISITSPRIDSQSEAQDARTAQILSKPGFQLLLAAFMTDSMDPQYLPSGLEMYLKRAFPNLPATLVAKIVQKFAQSEEVKEANKTLFGLTDVDGRPLFAQAEQTTNEQKTAFAQTIIYSAQDPVQPIQLSEKLTKLRALCEPQKIKRIASFSEGAIASVDFMVDRSNPHMTIDNLILTSRDESVLVFQVNQPYVLGIPPGVDIHRLLSAISHSVSPKIQEILEWATPQPAPLLPTRRSVGADNLRSAPQTRLGTKRRHFRHSNTTHQTNNLGTPETPKQRMKIRQAPEYRDDLDKLNLRGHRSRVQLDKAVAKATSTFSTSGQYNNIEVIKDLKAQTQHIEKIRAGNYRIFVRVVTEGSQQTIVLLGCRRRNENTYDEGTLNEMVNRWKTYDEKQNDQAKG